MATTTTQVISAKQLTHDLEKKDVLPSVYATNHAPWFRRELIEAFDGARKKLRGWATGAQPPTPEQDAIIKKWCDVEQDDSFGKLDDLPVPFVKVVLYDIWRDILLFRGAARDAHAHEYTFSSPPASPAGPSRTN